MNDPGLISKKLARDWAKPAIRQQLLLGAETFPLMIKIKRPTPQQVVKETGSVRAHVQSWRAVTVGRVIWEPVRYRGLPEPIALPVQWVIPDIEAWISAAADPVIQRQYRRLRNLLAIADPIFGTILTRSLNLWESMDDEEVTTALALALAITPGCAQGLPLRTLSLCGIDSKFFERNRTLMIRLLDARFDGAITALGLETFLDASKEGDHWLLVLDLDGCRLPFSQIRVRTCELFSHGLDAHHILIVENERCASMLPTLSDTIAILGAGLDLSWMNASWLADKHVGYWGDLDTWGLGMLSRARASCPHLTALLMDEAVWSEHAARAVAEPVHFADTPPEGLTESEYSLYQQLAAAKHGRLEQEFLTKQTVIDALTAWHGA